MIILKSTKENSQRDADCHSLLMIHLIFAHAAVSLLRIQVIDALEITAAAALVILRLMPALVIFDLSAQVDAHLILIQILLDLFVIIVFPAIHAYHLTLLVWNDAHRS